MKAKEPAKLPIPSDISPELGCDPEFFFTSNGEVIGAEKVIPKEGLAVGRYSTSKFIIDGVQAELNPRPNTCRANLANEIIACFKQLEKTLKAKNVKADFSQTAEISKENLMALDESSRKFGCAPSKSIYARSTGIKIDKVDPTVYRTRAAGGHIHIGKGAEFNQKHNGREWVNAPAGLYRAITKDHLRTVEMLDLLCGNSCVLIDRNPANKERRRVYGKAGEFRLPEHGLEYRTLSNFWLTAYPLMSFAFGMARLAVQLMADENHEKYYEAFMSRVKMGNVRKAINYNNFNLAMSNFKAIEDLIVDVSYGKKDGYMYRTRSPINDLNINDFHYFVNSVKEDGLGRWFPQDPMSHWTALGDAHNGGFVDFLNGPVRKAIRVDEATKKKIA